MTEKKAEIQNLESLLVRYGQDDPAVFSAIYEQMAPRLESYLNKRLRGNREGVQEVFQASFLRLHRYRHRYDSKFLAWQWLYTIARSELLDYLKRNEGQRNLIDKYAENLFLLSQTTHEASNTYGDIIDEISQLDEQTQNLIYGRVIEENSYQEMSERLGLSEANLRQKFSRALKYIKERLAKVEENEK